MKKLIIIAALVAGTGTAVADSARDAYARGQSAIKAGRVHQACEHFAESEKLEPNIETELSLADCYERDGKPVSAARMYRAAAEREVNLDRRKKHNAKADKLEAKAPKLRFAINPLPQGLVVKVDGIVVKHTEDVLVDTGPHEVTATAPGYEGRANAPVDREGAILDVILRMEDIEQPAPEPAKPATPAKPMATAKPKAMEKPMAKAKPAEKSERMSDGEPMEAPERVTSSHRRRNGYIVGAVGIGVLVGAGVTFGLSASKLDDERTLCPDQKCASDAELSRANELLDDARTLRGVSIGMGIGGALLVAGGTYLVLTGDSRVSLQASAKSAGVTFTARW